MPPQTRTRVTKLLKENSNVVKKNKLISDGKVTKPPRKALADKTNSLSDDNASIEIPIKSTKTVLKRKAAKSNLDNNVRPRRERKLPPRYIDNQVLKNLSNNQDSPAKPNPAPPEVHKPVKNSENSLILKLEPARNADRFVSANGPSKEKKIMAVGRSTRNCRLQSAIEKPASKSTDSSLNVSSPFKTPSKDLESSLVVNRPKRIHRLPSRFEDHSTSPNKFIPVQPCYASTPIQQKNPKTTGKNTDNIGDKRKVCVKSNDKAILKVIQKSNPTKNNVKADPMNSSSDKSSPDSNNNGKNKVLRAKRPNVITKLQTKGMHPEHNKITPFTKRLVDKSLSFRVLEDNKQTKDKGDNLDVYEFTFDPNEEPKQQKKKRKKPVKKRPAKPKVFALKSNYNDNVSKALENLKAKVKPSQSQPVKDNVNPTNDSVKPMPTEKVQSSQVITKPVLNDIPQTNNHSVNNTPAMPPMRESVKNSIHESNCASIRIEDIAADFESSDHHNDINYSPVNLPIQPATPDVPENNESHINPINPTNDPLNLQGDMSFFDEQPVASSSMNVSVRHPLASPWRVEFGNLPMKWQSDTYVKANMTPAVESSFINSEGMTKRKHVYTNIVPVDESLPKIVDRAPNLKQPSIISFMKEAAERSANKKKRQRPSPNKANSIFEDVTNVPSDFGYKTPKKAKITAKKSNSNVSNESNDKLNNKENSNQSSEKFVSPFQADKDKDCTYFGFDDSASIDQENVSPVKIVPNTRGLRSRAVLQEFNAQAGPTRATMPVAAKAKLTSSEAVEQLYDQLKSAEDAPKFPEKDTAKEPADNTVVTNVNNLWQEENDDSQSVHLFEDIEVVHHLKLHRKSYGKSKKVTFQQHSNSDSDTPPRAAVYSSDDDLADLTFQMPNIKEKKAVKKRKPKKQLSKKEEREADEWAAGFNSMCEDIDEFTLVVE